MALTAYGDAGDTDADTRNTVEHGVDDMVVGGTWYAYRAAG
jgi:hypothetical protein